VNEDPFADDERRQRARKVKPQYGEGELVKVAFARNQTEAEFVENLLLEAGIPSLVRRSGGFDVPDFLAAGPRDVLVPASGVSAARETLLQAGVETAGGSEGPDPRRVAIGLAIGFAALLAIIAVALLLGA
jgi:hypothetical protein